MAWCRLYGGQKVWSTRASLLRRERLSAKGRRRQRAFGEGHIVPAAQAVPADDRWHPAKTPPPALNPFPSQERIGDVRHPPHAPAPAVQRLLAKTVRGLSVPALALGGLRPSVPSTALGSMSLRFLSLAKHAASAWADRARADRALGGDPSQTSSRTPAGPRPLDLASMPLRPAGGYQGLYRPPPQAKLLNLIRRPRIGQGQKKAFSQKNCRRTPWEAKGQRPTEAWGDRLPRQGRRHGPAARAREPSQANGAAAADCRHPTGTCATD